MLTLLKLSSYHLTSSDRIPANLISSEPNWKRPNSPWLRQSEQAYWTVPCLCRVTTVITGFTVGFYVGCVT